LTLRSRSFHDAIHLSEFSVSQFSPPQADGSAITQPIDKKLILGEANAHVAGETAKQHQVVLFLTTSRLYSRRGLY
jgi:hypothetical protein